MLREIRFYSRGGQGGVTGAKLLAYAGSLEGLEVQAIPKYGAERKGAPLFVDVRLSDKPIKTHSPVGNMADHFIILEPSLITKMPKTRDDAIIVINSKDLPQTSFDSSNLKIGLVDAYRIAEEENLIKSGTPLVSTIMMGAWCKATDELISLKSIKATIEKYCTGSLQINNINGISKAFNEFKFLEINELLTN
jgi:pyruvate ferredoxin oxidoreductase gamma subunit